ncbi:TonB-dependent receptor [Kineobactrum salinum]|uniref:TonB-dependent receptor n=2 Tax=Kineobactrum salinum TaxID=2708301 RepID=A0A6C0UA34_9GAMM|nr:TonB-dependent receptor [Kineobactrum salinum]
MATSLCGGLGTAASTALAQSEGTMLEEIVVTAQKRSESLADVPIQVNAFTAQAIEDAGITSTEDVISQVPNVTFDRGNSYRSAFITMRGLTQINNADPPIAFIVDGVQQTNQETIGVNLFDLEQVEVLRGPQGTLYGRNAVGGAINVVTRAPGNEFEGYLRGSYAEGDSYSMTAAVAGPIVENKALFRLTANYKSYDGLIENSFNGDEADFIDDDYSVRGRVLLMPTEALTVDLRAEFSDYRGGSNYYSAVFSGDPNDFVDPQSNLTGFTDGETRDYTAKLDYDLGFATFTSITGYTDFEQFNRADLDFRNPVDSPGGFQGLGIQVGQGQDLGFETLNQEFRLVSNGDQRFRWLLGANYLQTDKELLTRGFIDLDGSYGQIDNPALLIANQAETNDNEAWGVFAQFDYDLSDTLTLTAGARYDEDSRDQTNLGSGGTRDQTFDHLQPKVTLTWQPQDERLYYATYSTGFRSGGFNAPNVNVTQFEQETLENFEIGFKSQFLDNRLNLSGAAFLTEVEDYQFFYVEAATASQVIDTIDKVRIQGLELELQAALGGGFDASLALGLTDSDIRESLFPEDEGNHTPRTMPVSATGALQYGTELGDGMDGFARLEWHYYGKKYWAADNDAVQDPYHIVNARAGVRFDNLELFLFGRNLLDEEYYGEFFQPKYSGLDVAIGYLGAPRVVGVEAKLGF